MKSEWFLLCTKENKDQMYYSLSKFYFALMLRKMANIHHSKYWGVVGLILNLLDQGHS